MGPNGCDRRKIPFGHEAFPIQMFDVHRSFSLLSYGCFDERGAMVETRRAPRPSLQLASSSSPLLEAAFFDLDRTLVPGSSLFPLALEMRRRRCMTSRQLVRLACDQLTFRMRGEGNRSVSRVRDASLGAIRGWPRDWLLEVGRAVVRASLPSRMYPQGAAVDVQVALFADEPSDRRKEVAEVQSVPGRGRAEARCQPLDRLVSSARTSEPDVRVSAHPALHEPVPLDYATDPSSPLDHGEGMRVPRYR